MDAKVPLITSILGGTVTIPTIDGDVELTIPAGTQPGLKKVLRQRGAKKIRGSRGDQIVTIKVTIPTGLSDQQKELLRKAFDKEASHPKPSQGSKPESKTNSKTEAESKSNKEEESSSFMKFFKDLSGKKMNC